MYIAYKYQKSGVRVISRFANAQNCFDTGRETSFNMQKGDSFKIQVTWKQISLVKKYLCTK